MTLSEALSLVENHEVIHLCKGDKSISLRREGDVLVISTSKPIRTGVPFKTTEPVLFIHNGEVIKIAPGTRGVYFKGKGFIRFGEKWFALGRKYLRNKTNKIFSFT